MKKQKKVNYESPSQQVNQVELENGLAQTVIISTSARLLDWEEGETQGDDPDEGGDVYLIY